jgi:hypothetical protein
VYYKLFEAWRRRKPSKTMLNAQFSFRNKGKASQIHTVSDSYLNPLIRIQAIYKSLTKTSLPFFQNDKQDHSIHPF